MPLTKQAQALVDEFASQPGVSADHATNLTSIINNSPALVSQINEAVRQGHLKHIVPLPVGSHAGTAGRIAAARGRGQPRQGCHPAHPAATHPGCAARDALTPQDTAAVRKIVTTLGTGINPRPCPGRRLQNTRQNTALR